MDIKLESEDANFAFPEVAPGTSPDNKSPTVRTAVNGIGLGGISGNRSGNASIGRVVGVTRPRPAMGVLTKRAPITHQGPVTLISQLCTSLDRCRISFNYECIISLIFCYNKIVNKIVIFSVVYQKNENINKGKKTS